MAIGRGNVVKATPFDILRDLPPRQNAALVFADPPWYELESIGFLWCAAAVCRTGGHVAMSIPPLDTRPGIVEERLRIQVAARTFGLRFLGIAPSSLGYETPFFEANAMRAAGSEPSVEWRSGDLALFVRESVAVGERPLPPIDDRWIEREIGNSRIRLRDGGSPVPG
jgi:hypothetical protein